MRIDLSNEELGAAIASTHIRLKNSSVQTPGRGDTLAHYRFLLAIQRVRAAQGLCEEEWTAAAKRAGLVGADGEWLQVGTP